MDRVTGADNRRANIIEELWEVSMCASIEEKPSTRRVETFRKQPGKTNPIRNIPPNTPNVRKLLRMNTPALDTGNCKVLGRSQLNYTILVHQLRELSELTFQLLSMDTMVFVHTETQDTNRTPSTQKKIGVARNSAVSVQQDQAEYTLFRYARASPTGLEKILGHKLHMLIDGQSGICMMSDEVAEDLNIGWKCVNWMMITADGN
jgi:hypothetical protein